LPETATEEQYELVRRELGLDRPLAIQYIIWLGKVVQADFGTSIRANVPVRDLIAERLPYSVKLAAVAISFAMLLGMGLGMVAALRKDSGIDTVAKVIAFLGMATPHFWLGIMLILVFSVWLGWLPTSGVGSPLHYLLPGFTLGWGTVSAGILRLTRSAMLDVLDAEYIKLARIKGVSESRVILIHSLRNALIPVLTFAGIYFALLIGVAVVVETVFTWPGIGRLAYEALMWRDFPVIQGVMLVIAAIVMGVNLVVDILYAYIDPRIRY
jgi:peptide/nickel transport system permease protein